MSNPIRILVRDYGWVHLSLGLFGNIAFFVGSVLFLPRFEPIQTIGVWLFIVGAFFMAIGSLGRLLLSLWWD
ncbi:MAG TPA: YrhK family protein [Alphaproteobacteria bacterium]|nr:YrhK family protein [Alphaproteobacteria bacterium]